MPCHKKDTHRSNNAKSNTLSGKKHIGHSCRELAHSSFASGPSERTDILSEGSSNDRLEERSKSIASSCGWSLKPSVDSFTTSWTHQASKALVVGKWLHNDRLQQERHSNKERLWSCTVLKIIVFIVGRARTIKDLERLEQREGSKSSALEEVQMNWKQVTSQARMSQAEDK